MAYTDTDVHMEELAPNDAHMADEQDAYDNDVHNFHAAHVENVHACFTAHQRRLKHWRKRAREATCMPDLHVRSQGPQFMCTSNRIALHSSLLPHLERPSCLQSRQPDIQSNLVHLEPCK